MSLNHDTSPALPHLPPRQWCNRCKKLNPPPDERCPVAALDLATDALVAVARTSEDPGVLVVVREALGELGVEVQR